MCSSHNSHSFDVRIIDSDPGNGKAKSLDSVSHYVTFELTITHDGSSYASKEPLRLEVEQACESDDEVPIPHPAIKDTANMQQLTTVLETNSDKFKLQSPATSTHRLRKLFKGFRKDKQELSRTPLTTPAVPVITQALAGFHIASPTSMTARASTTSDLSQVDDFYIKFHEVMTECIGRSLLGSWRGPHAQWYCVSPAPPTAMGTSQSLSDLIRWISEEPVLRSLPRLILVELAGNVAEGIMQFYKTPWLVPTSLGQNVRCFSPTGSSATAVQLKGPYFMARLDSSQSKGKMRATTTGARNPVEQTADFTDARNKLLFNFGILLLEIGYGKPWHELKQTVARMPTATGGKLTDYRAAEKLAQLLVNQMGLTYSKIIKKCLGCDFGLGEMDLNNEDLQRRFLEDVVLGLQQLKEVMGEANSRF